MIAMFRVHNKTRRSVTVLELLIAVFVLLIGITGVAALFPIGVHLSYQSSDDLVSAMTAQNALAAVRVQRGLLERVVGYVEGAYDSGDVLAWTGSISESVEDITAQVAQVGDPLDPDRIEVDTLMGINGRTLDVKDQGSQSPADPNDNCALLLMTSGTAEGKLYRLGGGSAVSGSAPFTLVTQESAVNFPGDGVEATDTLRLIGARDEDGVWTTVPEDFFNLESGGGLPPYDLGQGAAEGYGYLVLVARLDDHDTAFRVTVLVYKGYDRSFPPEGNLPAVNCYTTVLPGNLLR